MRFSIVLFLSIVLIGGCGGKEDQSQQQTGQLSSQQKQAQLDTATVMSLDPAIAKKLDPALKQKVAELKAADKLGEEVRILGKFKSIEKEKLRQSVSDLGGTIGTITTSGFTLHCPASSVLEIAKLEFIEYLELSQKVYPMKPND